MDCFFSLHYSPLLIGSALGSVFLASGWVRTGCACLSFFAAGTAAVFWCQPLRTIRAGNGSYNVGLKERCRDEAKGVPPLSVFYPCEKGGDVRVESWLPFRDSRYLREMARYCKMPYFLFYDLKQVKVEFSNSNRLPPLVTKNGPRTVYILSHGLSGFARLYTTLLLRLACKGAIVFSLTHTEGSAAFCRDEKNDFTVAIDTEIEFTTEGRKPQIVQRSNEVRNTLSELLAGTLFLDLGYTESNVQAYISNSPRVHFIGHSFGGATVLNAVAGLKDVSHVGTVSCFDPWHLPLFGVLEASLMEGQRCYSTPTLLFYSQEWFESSDIMAFFQEWIGGSTVKSGSVTIQQYCNTDHLSSCDMTVFTRVGKKKYCTVDPEAQIDEWATAILNFSGHQAE